MRKKIEGFLFWGAVMLLVSFIYLEFGNESLINGGYTKINFSEFLSGLENNQIKTVVIREKTIEGEMKNGTKFKTDAILYDNLINKLDEKKVDFSFVRGETFWGILGGILFSWMPILLLTGVWFFFIKQMQAGSNKTMSFGKSRAKKLMGDEKIKVTFGDIAGIEEAKEELNEVVDFLKHPKKFQDLGAKIPKGCLLIGPPGTGKTLLARAIAGEAGVPFFSISGSDFVEMFVGVGASRVRDMFDTAKKNAPCIVFIDEIDAVGRHRGIGLGGGNDEREQTLNQLLVEMDGFNQNEGIIIVAATNRPDVLDPALLRPGRFDRQITISLPDIEGRDKILAVHTKKIPLAPNVNTRKIAQGTPAFSGAQLASLVNEAAINAAKNTRKFVTMEDFEYARDKVMMGPERRSMVITEEEKRLTAYHESGHAIASLHCPESDPIHKATIIPRGRTLGLVMRLPEKDRVSYTKSKMLDDIVVALGGREAERLIFGENKITSGASSDIKQATVIAYSMVSQWGMSEKLGMIYYQGIGEQRDTAGPSEDTLTLIDEEAKAIINSCNERTREILSKNIDQLHMVASQLIIRETLTGDEIRALLDGKELEPIYDNSTSESDSSF